MIPGYLAALLARLRCYAVGLGEIGTARSITVSPRGALLFVAKLFTLLFNKWAARASDETEDEDTMEHSANPLAMFAEEDSREDNEAVVNGIDDSSEFEHPAADESQESHSPSPSWCLCKPWHCVVGWPQVHVDSTACRGT